ncbi:MAG: LacI family DNA-binding transcriptional regulator [Verrucomicrobiae bacterium]|nr:LacI family DNA-binding transcriptional regulator [Verrucomicrobiae bacterium]
MGTAHPSQSLVAQAAGVSQTAVSLALRNHPSIPERTRERIKAIAAQMGYRPNPYVAALMKQVRGRRRVVDRPTLAYLTSHPDRDGWRSKGLFRRNFEGAAERAADLGYRLEEVWLKEPGMCGDRASQVLWARSIDGVIIAPLPRGRGHVHLDWDRFAAATIGYSVVRPRLHRAAYHQMQSLSLGVRHLMKMGHERIGMAVPAETDARSDHAWTASFLMLRHQFAAHGRWGMLVTDDWHEAVFREWFQRWRPEVVLSSDLNAMQWLGRMGLRVPTDAGFVHLEWGQDEADCAGIRQNARMVGAAAVDLVVEQLERNERGLPDHPKVVLVGGDWMDGDTVMDRAGRSARQEEVQRVAAS